MAKRICESEITYRERTRGPTLLWAHREGTKVDIRKSAERLLASLRGEGLRHAAVFVDGRRIKPRKVHKTRRKKDG